MKTSRRQNNLLPESWRDAVAGDLEEEARATGRGRWWLRWHLLRAGARLRWTTVVNAVVTDLRYAVRSIVRTPWFAVGAVFTFAVGFGVNLATFSAVDRILFQTPPYGDPGRLVALEPCPLGTHINCAYNQLFQLVDLSREHAMSTIGSLASIGIPQHYDAATSDGPALNLITATPDLLRVLDVRPALGRGPTDAEGHEAVSVAVLSYEAWHNRFGASLSVMGQMVGSAPALVRVIGILPASFMPPFSGVLDRDWDGLVFTDGAGVYEPVARLRPGATVGAAQAEVNVMMATIKPPEDWRGPTFVQVVPIDQALFQTVSKMAWLIVAVVALLFLMATANLTGLMLARGRSRERDAALRSALGASLARVTAATMAESFVICVLGASLAWLAMALASETLRSVLPPIFARLVTGPLDRRVLGFTLAAAVVMTVAAGLWPALHVARTDVVAVLGQAAGGTRGHRFLPGRTLVTIEATLGITVVLVAVLVTTSFSILVDQGTGFRIDGLYYVTAIGKGATRLTPEQSVGRYRVMLSAVSRIPGVVGVANEDQSPATDPFGEHFSNDPAQPGARYELSAGAFAVLGTPLIAGREFTAGEVTAGAPVAILNEAGAALLAPGVPVADLVGQTVPLKDESARQIVGIVPEVRSWYGQTAAPEIFVPLTKPRRYVEFLMRLAPSVRPDVESLSQRLSAEVGPVRVEMWSLSDGLDWSLVEPRFRAVLFIAIAICGLVLAAAGLYALTAFEVARRTREMGIRLALGASGRRLQWFVAADVLRPVLVGSLAGLVLTLWAVRFIRLFLYQMSGREPGVYVMAAVILIGTAALTAWLPARRAARTDPATVLRTQ